MRDISSHVDRLFDAWAKPASPGAAVAVMREGEIVFKRGYGMANLDHDVPIKPSSVFHAASVSKQFTAAAIHLLALEGRLSLDDDVRRHLPQLPDFGATITLGHLIHHTSGLRDQWELLGLAGWRYAKDLITDDDVLRLVCRQRELNFAPGARFLYCNTGYTLLAQVVQAVTGQSLRRFTDERIFGPLGMRRTFFRDRHGEVVKGMAYGYQPCGEGYELALTNFDTVGATSLLTSVEDLTLWDANFRSGRVGGKALLDAMHTRGILSDGSEIDYGGGVILGAYCGLATVEHPGADAGYRSVLFRIPERGLSIAILSNLSSMNPARLARQIADAFIEAEASAHRARLSVERVQLPPAQALKRLAGIYIDEKDGDRLLQLHLKEGKLLAAAPEQDEALELEAIGATRFRHVLDPRLEIAVENEQTLALLTDGRCTNRFVRLGPDRPSTERLKEFVGAYTSPETGYRYDIIMRDGSLLSTALRQAPEPMTAVAGDLFITRGFRVRFRRDAAGAIIGLVLNSDRTRNFHFDRLPA